jgi:hypothetical protein
MNPYDPLTRETMRDQLSQNATGYNDVIGRLAALSNGATLEAEEDTTPLTRWARTLGDAFGLLGKDSPVTQPEAPGDAGPSMDGKQWLGLLALVGIAYWLLKK